MLNIFADRRGCSPTLLDQPSQERASLLQAGRAINAATVNTVVARGVISADDSPAAPDNVFSQVAGS